MHRTASYVRPHSPASVASHAASAARVPLALAPPPSASAMAPPALSPALGLRLAPGGGTHWRAINRDGRVIGHVQPVHTPEGLRFRARRYRPHARRFLDLGDFWNAEDAAWCLRYTI